MPSHTSECEYILNNPFNEVILLSKLCRDIFKADSKGRRSIGKVEGLCDR